jgi:hypothetical protein
MNDTIFAEISRKLGKVSANVKEAWDAVGNADTGGLAEAMNELYQLKNQLAKLDNSGFGISRQGGYDLPVQLTKYGYKEILNILLYANSAQDLIHLLQTSSESSSKTVPGMAIALEKLIEPVTEFLEWAQYVFPSFPKEKTMVVWIDKNTFEKGKEQQIVSFE